MAEPAAPKFTVLTVDHGLRAAAAAEATQVGAWAQSCGLPHATLRWEGSKPATGLQARARSARYDLMTAWCKANGADWLLTAHTQDDQAETVLMRMARTASVDSLAGIAKTGAWQGVALFRPLLALRREALREYLRSLGQPWIDDPSNDDERFERVRIRKALAAFDGTGLTTPALADLASDMSEAAQGLWGATDNWVKAHVSVFDTGYCLVPRGAFDDQISALKSRILSGLITRFGGRGMPQPDQLQRLAGWPAGGGSRATLGGALIARRRGHLLIGREPGRIDPAPVLVPPGGGVRWDNRFDIEALPGASVVPAGSLSLPRRRDIPAFVQAGMPAIRFPDGAVAVPHLGLGPRVRANFRETTMPFPARKRLELTGRATMLSGTPEAGDASSSSATQCEGIT